MSEILKQILITGGNGFLAKSFTEKLRDDVKVVSCSRTELDLLDSIVVSEYLKKTKFDVIIHTATYDAAPKGSEKDRTKVLENNLRMFFNLARCNDSFGKMIYFGSGAEFNRDDWIPDMDESYFDIHVPVDQYGFSKYIMNQYAETTANIFNLRLFGVFGEYDDWRYRFISNACCHAVLGMPIHVHNNAIADFLYIDDLARIMLWFIQNEPKHQSYNVCSGKSYEYLELANMIKEIAKNNVDVTVNNKYINKNYSGNNSRLLEELGNFEFTPMKTTLEKLYNWYQYNKHLIDATKFHF